MATLTPSQRAWRGRIETGLRFVSPLLDLLLAVGDRLSRAVDREELEPAATPRSSIGPGTDEQR